MSHTYGRCFGTGPSLSWETPRWATTEEDDRCPRHQLAAPCDGIEHARRVIQATAEAHHAEAIKLRKECPTSSESFYAAERAATCWNLLEELDDPPQDNAQPDLLAESERLKKMVPPETNRSGGGVSQGSWSVFAEKVVMERDEALDEVARLRERLQFDPGGSDKIDELEQALQFSQHEVECLKKQLEELTGV